MQQTVDDVVIIARGRLVRASTLAELEGAPVVLARSPRATALVDVLRSAGLAAELVPDRPGGDLVRVATPDPAAVGHAAYGAGIELHELRAEASDLERIFLDLTGDAR